jgi:hypothetical protein
MGHVGAEILHTMLLNMLDGSEHFVLHALNSRLLVFGMYGRCRFV